MSKQLLLNFNQDGSLSQSQSTGSAIRQGDSNGEVTLVATFQNRRNDAYVAKLHFERPDGKKQRNIVMTPSASQLNQFDYSFLSGWFFAVAGTAKVTVTITDSNGAVSAQGSYSFAVEPTQVDVVDSTITYDEAAELEGLIAKLAIGYFELPSYDPDGYLDDEQAEEARKTFCFIKRGNDLFLFAREYEGEKIFETVPLMSVTGHKQGWIEISGLDSNSPTWEYVRDDYDMDSAPTQNSTNLITSGGVYNAVATKADLVNGKVPAEQLPSYVDDVLEYANYMAFPATGEQGKIYVALDTNFIYRWSGTAYVRVNEADLSDYYTKSQTDSAIDADVAALSEQVADGTVVAGKASKDASGNVIPSTYATKTEASALDAKISKNAEDIATLTEALIKKDLYETQEATFQGMTAVPAGAMVKAYLDGFKGNSAVVNQLVQNGNFESNSGWFAFDGTLSVSNNTARISFSENAPASARLQRGGFSFVAGHTYLITAVVSSSISNTAAFGYFITSSVVLSDESIGTSKKTLFSLFTPSASGTGNIRLFVNRGGTGTTGDYVDVENFMLIDLTLAGLTTAEMADVATAKAALKHKGMDVDSYIPYNTGTLTDCKERKLISRGYNLFDGEWNFWSGGGTTVCTGLSYIEVDPSQSYSWDKKGITTTASMIIQYDENKRELGTLYVNNNNLSGTLSAGSFNPATRYIRPQYWISTSVLPSPFPTDAYCFHLTTGRTGYAPYVPPIEYDLTLPTLKSAGSVQDESKAGGMKVKKDDLGDLTFSASGSTWNASLPLAKPTDNNQSLPEALCSTYTRDTTSNIIGATPTNKTFAFSTGSVTMRVYDTSITQASDVQGKINYQLATPTDFSDPISYPEIIDVEAGGSVEVVGDGCDATTKVYFYVEA